MALRDLARRPVVEGEKEQVRGISITPFGPQNANAPRRWLCPQQEVCTAHLFKTPTDLRSIQSRQTRFHQSKQPVRVAFGHHEAIRIAAGEISLRDGDDALSDHQLGLDLDFAESLDA